MVRYKGQVRPKDIERDFPNIVRFLVPEGGLGRRLDEMATWHEERGLTIWRGVGSRSGAEWYVHYCFAKPQDAETFKFRFDGQSVDSSKPQRKRRARG